MIRRGLLIAVLLSAASAHGNALSSNKLETIIVTASRSEQAGQRLASAWTDLSADVVDFTRLQHSNQVFQRVPGAWISRNNGQESLISLRSPVLTGAGSCGAFLTAEDSIGLRAPGFCNVNQLFDANLAQAGGIEVLRGPDSAVFGSNAMHGIINVMTRTAAQTGNQVRFESGSRDFFRGSLGLSDVERGLALNLQASSYGGYQDNSGYDQQKLTGRWDGDVGEWRTTAVISASNLNQETAGFVRGFEVYRDEALSEQNPNPEAYRDARSLRTYLRGVTALHGNRQLSITLYARDNDMEFLQHFLPWQATEQNGHSSIGLQSALSGRTESLDWQFGLDVDATDGFLTEDQAEPFSPNQPQGIHYDYQVDALTTAAFIQAGRDFDNGWRLAGGLRLEATDYDYDNLTGNGSACAPEASACRFFRPADRSDDFSNWTGNLSLLRDLGSHQLYGRLARGFRAPQTSELYRLQGGQLVADIDSESISSVELGSRGSFGSGLSYALNAYWMTKDDVIFQSADRFNVSGAETAHRGIELEANWQINDIWASAIAASYARHTYESAINLLGARTDISGNLIDTAPRHFGSWRLNANFAAIGLPLFSELEVTWLDEYYLDPDNANTYEGHTLVNLRSEYTLTERLNLSLVISNLANTDYAERADFGFGSYRYFVGEPRTALIGVSYQL